jgi:hypothetical protein
MLYGATAFPAYRELANILTSRELKTVCKKKKQPSKLAKTEKKSGKTSIYSLGRPSRPTHAPL